MAPLKRGRTKMTCMGSGGVFRVFVDLLVMYIYQYVYVYIYSKYIYIYINTYIFIWGFHRSGLCKVDGL